MRDGQTGLRAIQAGTILQSNFALVNACLMFRQCTLFSISFATAITVFTDAAADVRAQFGFI